VTASLFIAAVAAVAAVQATHHNVRKYAWVGWIVVALAVVVFAWIGRWWVRNLRRKRPT
jgi:uncharacterized membrane protein YfcA